MSQTQRLRGAQEAAPAGAPAPSVPQASAAGAPQMPAAVMPLAPTAIAPPMASAAAHGEAWPGLLTLPPDTATAQASLGAAMQIPTHPMMATYLRPEHGVGLGLGLGLMSRVHDFAGEAPLPTGLGLREGAYGHLAQALPDGAYGVQMLQGMGQAFVPPLGQAHFPPGIFAGVVDGQVIPQGFAHAVATIGEPAAYLSFNAQGQ